MRVCVCGGGGGYYDTSIYMYTWAADHFLGVQSFEFQFFLVFSFQKKEYFWGYDEIVDIFGGYHKTELFFFGGEGGGGAGVRGAHLYTFEVEYFLWGGLNFKYFFEVNSRCLVQAYVSRK